MKECDFCGAKNEDWMEICINCGRDLKDAKEIKVDEEKEKKLDRVGRQDNTNLYLMLIFIVLLILFFILLMIVLTSL